MDFNEILLQFTNPITGLIAIFRTGLWVVFLPLFIWMAREGWLNWMQGIYASNRKYVLMAVDVPRENEQSMKAVEQIIAAFHGAFYTPNKKQKWWDGVLADRFSLEIASIDGYIQYFVGCEHYNVELVKGAIYAQYPDAEIIEVEDYTPNVPEQFPNDTHDMFGTEYVLTKPDFYPIKTYEQFEHPLTGVYADPMAAVLELMSRLKPGEQVWLQMMVTPADPSWREDGIKEVHNLIEKKLPTSATLTDKALNAPLKGLEMLHESIFATGTDYNAGPEGDEGSQGNFLNMTTGEKLIVEEVQKKISRIPFRFKFRFLYIAKKDVFEVYRVANSIMGSIKQFNTLDLNSFTWGGYTTTHRPTYLFKEWRRNWRKNRLRAAYKFRSDWAGEGMKILSHVEIASLWHFPIMTVKAPLVSKSAGRTSEPPVALPIEQAEAILAGGDVPTEDTPAAPEGAPAGLPIEDAGMPTTASASSVPLPPPPPAAGDAPRVRTPQLTANFQAPPPPQNVQSGAASTAEYPLHSMPGLPPGVQPVDPNEQVQQQLPPSQLQPVSQQAPQAPVVQPDDQADASAATAESEGGAPPPNLPLG